MSDFRKRVLGPTLIPVGAFVFIGALVFGFSRLLLVVPKDGSVVLGILLSGCILFGAGALSKGGSLKNSQRMALVAFAVLLIVGGVAAGTSMHTRETEGGPPPIGAELVAKGIKFDKAEIELPADERVGILFDNQDAGVLHNVSIFDLPPGTATHLQEPPFPGVRSTIYELEDGLAKGVYLFRCDVHPTQMTGRVLVGGAAAPPAPTPAPGGSAPTTSSPSPSPAATAQPTTIALVAQNLAFDKKELAFPAGGSVTIDLDNRDAGLLHNFSLYGDSAFTQNIFRGEFGTGPTRSRYTFQAPGPGTYFFQCDAHPVDAMRGTVTVT